MDLSPYYGAIVIIATAIYMAIGYYYKGLKQGESFDWKKCGETVALVVLLTVTGLMSGVTVTADWISAMLGSLGDNPVAFTAIVAALIGLIDQFVKNGGRILTKGTTTESVVTTQTKASLPATTSADPVKTTEGRLPDANVSVLGIYGDSASAHTPAPSFTCDVNQVPQLFADLKVLVAGNGFYSIFINGEPLKDNQMQNFEAKEAGKTIPISFWIPQKYRVPGKTQLITITTGAETTEDFGLNNDKAEIPITFTSQNFGLTFTGTKASE